MTVFFHMLYRHAIVVLRKPMAFLLPLLFFILVCVLFPLSLSPSNQLLKNMGAGVIWIAIVLSQLLSLPSLFADDYDNGVLDQCLLQRDRLTQMVIAKLLAHWLFFIFPMILLAPVLAVMYNLSFFTIQILAVSLLLGTPIIVIQGAIIAAVSVGLHKNSLLLAILLLPLYIPTLIFGTSVVYAAASGFSVLFQLDLLGALLVASLIFGPMVIAFALRVGIIY